MRKTNAQYWYSPKKVAEMFELTPATITRWCREGRFSTAVKVGRVWRIGSSDPYLNTPAP